MVDRLVGLGPEARTSTSCPRRAASVATRLRLPAGTGAPPVVRLRSWTDASSARTSLTSRAAVGRAARAGSRPRRLRRPALRRPRRRPRGRRPDGAVRCEALPMSASRASAATSARLAPPAAATAATMSPSTIGAGESVTRLRVEGSRSRSSASSALSTALPRSMSTTTPAGPSDAFDGLHDGDRVGPERRFVQTCGHLDRQRTAVQHVRRQRHRGMGQRTTVGDDDQPDTVLGVRVGESPARLCVMSAALRSLVTVMSGSIQGGQTASRLPLR